MNRRLPTIACAIAATLAVQTAPQLSLAQGSPNRVTLLIPSFASPSADLGESIGTILMLHVWKSLRGAAPCPPPGSLAATKARCVGLQFFDEGRFRWQKRPLDNATHAGAEATASLQAYRAQLVFWGRTYRYGNDVVVLSFLTLPDLRDGRTRHNERWSLSIRTPQKVHVIDVDIPARSFAFEPIVLTSAFVSEFSLPTRLKVYRTPAGQGFIGYAVSPILEKIGQQGNSLQTRQGWILVPELSNAPSEAVNFVGGVTRIFRGDWSGAIEMLEPVANSARTPTELRIDSMLLMGLATYRAGGDFQSHLRAAEKLNPLASRVARYRIMGMLAELEKADAPARRDVAAAVKQYVQDHRTLFSADDRWLASVDDLLVAVTQ